MSTLMKPDEIAASPLPEHPVDALKELEDRRMQLFSMMLEAAEARHPGIERAITTVVKAEERIRAAVTGAVA